MPVSFRSPYPDAPAVWLRGNLHTHTALSDGWAPPKEVVAAYEQEGYDFLAVTDHDRRESLAELQAATPMALIEGSEVSANGPHVLAVGVCRDVAPHPDRQAVLNDIAAQTGLAVLNHPNWLTNFSHYPQELMEALTGYAGLEIYNGVVEWLEGSALATDRWDRLLSVGRVVWGFANDDAHRALDVGRAWNVAAAADRSVPSILQALRCGRFYASTGVRIDTIACDGSRIRVASRDAQRIRFVGSWGRQLALADGDEAEYAATGEEGPYVRVELLGAGGRMAWTQPFLRSEPSLADGRGAQL